MKRASLALAALGVALASCGESAAPEAQPEAVFIDAAEESGLVFEHFVGASGAFYLPEIMGSGAAVFDYDGDGDLDVLFLQGAMLDPDKSPSEALFPPPENQGPGARLFRNELIPSGELRFTDVTGTSGIRFEAYGMGAAVADFDNDGHPDIFLTAFGPNALYRNNGDGTFSEVTAPGMDDARWTASAAFLDYDGDGLLDLFFTNYVDFSVRNNKECFHPTGVRDYCSPTMYRPAPDRLFRNEGGGRWRDVSESAGLGRAFGNGLGVAVADYNGDGLPDIYVANDGVANQLWINQGGGRFENTALLAGVAYNADGMPEASMGVTAGDFDGDGDEDLFMTHLALETNTLYVNDGTGQFRDMTARYGLGGASTPFTGFGSAWIDYVNNGLLDLFIANGAVTIMESQIGEPYPFFQTNQLFRNLGERFEDVSKEAGLAFGVLNIGRGAAFGDIDNDGGIDIVVANNNGKARLLLNQAGQRNNWVRVRLEGAGVNRDALGARVALLREGRPPVWRRVHTDGSYLSASEPAVTFGLGEETRVAGLGVIWPGGEGEVFRDIQINKLHRFRQGSGEPWQAP